ncbi:unnamed protein product [Linum tenue]|uniref:TMEM205-like domain-containing protein n=1 Tax=Linum tenue TaxID=586396 RepID=A0AAV0N3G0_9ROSI|nr:unnamed protein product [Linum tenue]
MTNILSICLVLTTLLAAEIWSPPIPAATSTSAEQVQPREEDVIVKEGHRVVVVETFDDHVGHHNTKISISPSKDQPGGGDDDPASASGSALPLFGGHAPGELICDAWGKCTHKVAKAFGDAKDRAFGSVKEPAEGAKHGVYETAHQATEKASELAEGAKHGVSQTAHHATEKASELSHGAKDTGNFTFFTSNWLSCTFQIPEIFCYKISVARATHHANEKASELGQEAAEKASQAAHGARETVTDALDKGKETASEAAAKAREAAKGVYSKTKETATDSAGEVKDLGKTIGSDVTRNVSEGIVDDTQSKMHKGGGGGGKMGRIAAAGKSLAGALSLLGLSTAFGTSVWVTFISSYVLANVLPRQQFGVVQSKVYPVYFQAMGLSTGLALLGHLLGRGSNFVSAKSEMLQAFNLVAAIALVVVNGMYIEPLATKAMFERMRIEKEEGRGRGEQTQQHQMADAGPAAAGAELAEEDAEEKEEEETNSRLSRLNSRVKRLNSYSSWLNILALMALTWHLVHLGHALHAVAS